MDKQSKEIVNKLKKHPEGLSITQLNSILPLNRNSIARYVEVLTTQGVLKERIIGPAKLYTFYQEIPYLEQLKLFKLAMDVASCGITIADAKKDDFPLIYVNKEFCRLTGYEESDILGKNCRFLQGNKREQEALSILRDTLKKGESCSVSLINYHKDGTELINNLSISPIKDSEGVITHYVGIQNIAKK